MLFHVLSDASWRQNVDLETQQGMVRDSLHGFPLRRYYENLISGEKRNGLLGN